jgi:hypothetical protein
MVWLWHDKPDSRNIAAYATATFWYVIPSLPMFLLIAALLNRGASFWFSLLAGCVLTILLYAAMTAILPHLGVRL